MLIFENSGEIDPRLITLIGVNVKPSSSNPIGYFGTGLKYSIASLLRNNHSIIIQSGLSEFSFSTSSEAIRGATFQVIKMHSKIDSLDLAFTTDLGRNWKPWMIYRELWSNCQDEPSPNIFLSSTKPSPSPNLTRIIVDGPAILEAHQSRAEFLLPEDPSKTLLAKTPEVEIYDGTSSKIFYRGIAVQGLEKPSLYTYNITEQLFLTEDRTASTWQTDSVIALAITFLEDLTMLDVILTASNNFMESRLDYSFLPIPSPSVFSDRAAEMFKSHPLEVHKSIRQLFDHAEPTKLCPSCGRPL